jgi:multiphosphoryl transfer protein
MVGLVLVSHSRKLAESVRELVLQMTAPDFPVAVAAGVGDNYDQLGTDAVHIADVLQKLSCPEGVLVLMDLGSAVLSAQTALELLDCAAGSPIRLCPAPLVEGAIAAAVRAQAGGNLEEVAHEAGLGLAAKQQQVQSEAGETPEARTESLATPPAETAEIVLTVENQHGLHARPAAAFVQAASRFSSSVDVFNLKSGRGPASARSLTSLALLQVRPGDRIKVVCSGPDCHAAIKSIRELADKRFGEPPGSPSSAPPVAKTAVDRSRAVPASDGIAIGPLAMPEMAELPDTELTGEPAGEMARLIGALDAVRQELRRAGVPESQSTAASGAILEAQAMILDDPVVWAKLQSLVDKDRLSASRAWLDVTRELAAQYEAMDDPYLRERAADIRDIGRRVLREMKGAGAEAPIRLAHPAILFMDELLPTEAAGCDHATVLGVITNKGSATSHSAIILRTLGIPMIVGATGIGESDVGKTVAMDGSTGELWIDPGAETIARLESSKQVLLQRRMQAEAARSEPSVTLDGTRITVLANVGNARDAARAAENGAEGVGLLRTEFLFLSRTQVPTEDEQIRALREIYAAVSGPIIVRTLDVGADKPLPFLPQREEHNPYLGVRGIRLSLQFPELVVPHLRGILRSAVGHEIWLMFPMISVVREVSETLRLLEQAHRQLQGEGKPHAWPIKSGVMIEVPSAALLTDQLAEGIDFFSIGTNDLTQYTMAAERGNAAVGELQDALHPAVLRLMKTVVEGAATRQRHVSVCGDAASDPASAAVFAGLGIRELSVRPAQVAEIKAMFRRLRVCDLQRLAREALHCADAASVRKLAKNCLASVSQNPVLTHNR